MPDARRLTRALIGVGGALAAAGAVSACGSAPRGSAALGVEPGQHLLPDLPAPPQRLVGPPGSVVVSSDSGPGGSRSPRDWRFELTASGGGRGGRGLDRETRGALAAEWDDRFQLDGELRYGDLLSLELHGDFLDRRGPAEDGGLPFVDGLRGGWEHNRVGDATVVLGALDDRLRLTSRHASSSYRLSGPYRKRLTTRHGRDDDDDEGKERFLNGGAKEGTATLHRLDAEIWRSANLSASVFGLYSEVDRYFESVELADGDPFATSNRKTLTAGTTLGLGPVEVTLSRSLLQRTDEADAPKERQHEATIGLDLDDLRSRLGGGAGGTFAEAVMPASAWVSVARGEVEGTGGPGAPDDRTEDLSFGLAWSWPGSYANLDFWHSRYDDRQPGPGDYDWVGHGIYAGFGLVGGERWNLDAGFGLYRSEDQEVTIRSTDAGYDGTLSLTYRPEALPDLTASVYLGRYDTDYVAYGGSSRTDAWELGLAADLSRYLPAWSRDGDQSLQLTYRFEGLSTRDSFAGATAEIDHTVAVLFRLGL